MLSECNTLSLIQCKSKCADREHLAMISWCQPCRMLSPILTKLASAEANEKTGSGAGLDLITVNTDEQGDLAMQYEVCRDTNTQASSK